MNEGQFIWLAIITGSQVLQIIVSVYSLKRKPPVSEELYKDFLSKAEHESKCTEAKKAVATNVDTVAALVEATEKNLELQIQAIDARVDLLDGHNTETHLEIFGAIRDQNASVQADFKVLERGLGRVEGKLTKLIGEGQ